MVEYINYNDKKYPFRVKYYALMMFKKETGKSFESLQKAAEKAKKEGKDSIDLTESGFDEFSMLEPLLYYSLISGLKFIDPTAKLDLKREDMFNVLEECFLEFATLMPKFFKTEEVEEVEDETGAEVLAKKPLENQPQKKKKMIGKKKQTTAKNTE